MQRYRPGAQSYWLHFHTEALGEQPFLDARGDESKWTVEMNDPPFSRQGKPACTMWHSKPGFFILIKKKHDFRPGKTQITKNTAELA